MFIGLTAHIADLIILAVIALALFFIVRGVIRDRKAGKSSCGGSCAGCGACAGCSGCSACTGGCPAQNPLKKQNT